MSTQNSKTGKISKSTYLRFQELFKETKDEEIDSRAHIISLIFLSEAEKAMDSKGWTKKKLAQEIGTSASYLTQLFRGDRLLNLKTIARIENALNIRFEFKASSITETKNYSEHDALLPDPVQVNDKPR